MTYVVITFVVLLFLNIYCSRISQRIFYLNKESSMMEKCQLASSEIAKLDVLNQSTISNLISQMDANKTQQSSYQSKVEEELEAYRRAERTERFARERAENLYRQANGALADATAKVDEAANEVGQVTDRVIAQLAELQDVVSGSKQALREAAATMYTIRPTLD